MKNPTYNIIVRFDTMEKATQWFVQARWGGTLPDRAGLRKADGLDVVGHRPAAGDLIVSSDPGAGGWLVAPVKEDD